MNNGLCAKHRATGCAKPTRSDSGGIILPPRKPPVLVDLQRFWRQMRRFTQFQVFRRLLRFVGIRFVTVRRVRKRHLRIPFI